MARNKLLQAPQIQSAKLSVVPFVQNVPLTSKSTELLIVPVKTSNDKITQVTPIVSKNTELIIISEIKNVSEIPVQQISTTSKLLTPVIDCCEPQQININYKECLDKTLDYYQPASSTIYIPPPMESGVIPPSTVNIGAISNTNTNNITSIITSNNIPSLELDPIFRASPASSITLQDIINWNLAFDLQAGEELWSTAYDYEIVGLRDGLNRTFTIPNNYVRGTPKVYLGGLRLQKGIGWDYVESLPNKIIFEYAPSSIDLILIDYITIQ